MATAADGDRALGDELWTENGPWAAAAVGGARAAARVLHDAVSSERLSHAWLLVGPDGVGQRELSIALAASANCVIDDAPSRPCGICDACLRTLRDVHPALVTFEPDGAAHRVEDVRGAWTEAAMRTTPEARRKVLRVVAVDRMNVAAQNAFLKLLEEPPASVVWVLEAEDPGRLLETILSRVRRLDLPPWSAEDVRTWLAALLGGGAGGGPEDAVRIESAVCAARSSGDWLRGMRRDLASVGPREAREVLDTVLRLRGEHLAIVDRLAQGGPGVVVPTSKRLVGIAKERREALADRHAAELAGLEEAYGVEGTRGWPPGVKTRIEKRFERIARAEEQRTLRLMLDDLAGYLRDLIAVVSGAGVEALVNADVRDALQRDARLLHPVDLLAAIEAVGRCRAALDRNGAPELHVERLLLAIATSLYVRSAA
jgi:DNA polymerase III subunit delta'